MQLLKVYLKLLAKEKKGEQENRPKLLWIFTLPMHINFKSKSYPCKENHQSHAKQAKIRPESSSYV